MMDELEIVCAALSALYPLARLGLLVLEQLRKRNPRCEATLYRCEAEDSRPGG
jgi:hypothetical protein